MRRAPLAAWRACAACRAARRRKGGCSGTRSLERSHSELHGVPRVWASAGASRVYWPLLHWSPCEGGWPRQAGAAAARRGTASAPEAAQAQARAGRTLRRPAAHHASARPAAGACQGGGGGGPPAGRAWAGRAGPGRAAAPGAALRGSIASGPPATLLGTQTLRAARMPGPRRQPLQGRAPSAQTDLKVWTLDADVGHAPAPRAAWRAANCALSGPQGRCGMPVWPHADGKPLRLVVSTQGSTLAAATCPCQAAARTCRAARAPHQSRPAGPGSGGSRRPGRARPGAAAAPHRRHRLPAARSSSRPGCRPALPRPPTVGCCLLQVNRHAGQAMASAE